MTLKLPEWAVKPGALSSATEATIQLGVGVSVAGYMLPDGRIRYALEYVSILLGYAENYFSRLTKKSQKKWKALIDKGFTAYLITVKAPRLAGGATVAKTISFDDFCLLVEYEAELQNPKAIALLTASFRELLRSRTQIAFELPQDTLERKLATFEDNYQTYLQREVSLAEDREDLEDLLLPGDDLYYPTYRDWTAVEVWEDIFPEVSGTLQDSLSKPPRKRKSSPRKPPQSATMPSSQTPQFRSGQLIPLRFKEREIMAVVIDPNGLGQGRPSIGMGFRGMDRHTGVPQQTLSDRVTEIEGVRWLQLPSGARFRVTEILGEDGNTYQTVEASDWVGLASDWAKEPGKLRKPARDGLIDFLAWFAAEGIYAQAYTFLKRTYTRQDDEAVRQWLLSREVGKTYRKDWGWEVKEKDPGRYGYWTNYVYQGLFGMDATEMKQTWEKPVSGSKKIARNYIPQAIGLEAVAYCEKMVSQLELDDLNEAHEVAIHLTKGKFAKYFPASR